MLARRMSVQRFHACKIDLPHRRWAASLDGPMSLSNAPRAALCLVAVVFALPLACSSSDSKKEIVDPPDGAPPPKKTTLAAFTQVSDPWVKYLVVGARSFVDVPHAPDCASDLGFGRIELTDAELSSGSVPYVITYGKPDGSDATISGTMSLAGITRETCNPREIVLQDGQLTFGSGSNGGGGSPDAGAGHADGGMRDAGVSLPDSGAGVPDGGAPIGDSYLIYGVVWVPASTNCAEGSAFFSDWAAYYAQVTPGPYSSTFGPARETLLATMKAEHPGAREYVIESSYFVYGKTAQHAVIIGYSEKPLAWDCHPELIAIGYGVTYDEALTKAKAKMGASASGYTELDHASW
jgi:hypothetical protein